MGNLTHWVSFYQNKQLAKRSSAQEHVAPSTVLEQRLSLASHISNHITNCFPFSCFAGLQASGELGEDRQDHRVHHHCFLFYTGCLHTGLIVSTGQGIMRSGAGSGFGAGKGTDAGNVAAGEQGKCTICLNAQWGKGEEGKIVSVGVSFTTIYSRNSSWAICAA